jgi:hypothetical protein
MKIKGKALKLSLAVAITDSDVKRAIISSGRLKPFLNAIVIGNKKENVLKKPLL